MTFLVGDPGDPVNLHLPLLLGWGTTQSICELHCFLVGRRDDVVAFFLVKSETNTEKNVSPSLYITNKYLFNYLHL